MSESVRIGLVLAGGGARGAYEAGAVAGLVEVARARGLTPRFDVLCGTSIGALNAAWLAAHAHETDLGTSSLCSQWESLSLKRTFKIRWSALASLRSADASWSLLDASYLDSIVREGIPWAHLHDNIDRGRVQVLLVSALNIAGGLTTTFAELAPGAEFRPSRDPRRGHSQGRIEAEHVLASSAFPWVFPARVIGDEYYCDGGLRYNTPIAPALRAGSDRLVVVSPVRRNVRPQTQASRVAAFASPVFLLGKLINALLLDPLQYDLHVLERFNRLLQVLDQGLPVEMQNQVHEVLQRNRGASYRVVDTYVIEPSEDIAELSTEHLQSTADESSATRMLRKLAQFGRTWEADLVSFLLMDGAFSARLVELGRKDVLARADELCEVFR